MTTAGSGCLLTNDGRPLNRHVVTRMVNRAGRRAGLGHVHPHQLRHTLATQAINRGMRLEAIAALLGHRTLRMTIRYARIANRTVADEYQAVTAKVEALYSERPLSEPRPRGRPCAGCGPSTRRMLGNGWCTRPAELDCSFEAMCEGCGFFATTVEFKDTLEASVTTPPVAGSALARASMGAWWTTSRRPPLDAERAPRATVAGGGNTPGDGRHIRCYLTGWAE